MLTKLDKTDSTDVHTCPFFIATEGELAVYTLQRIYKKNWYDFEEFEEYKIRKDAPQEIPVSNLDNLQGWLQEEVLRDDRKREILKNLWLKEMENYN